jgi:hypothetical protein
MAGTSLRAKVSWSDTPDGPERHTLLYSMAYDRAGRRRQNVGQEVRGASGVPKRRTGDAPAGPWSEDEHTEVMERTQVSGSAVGRYADHLMVAVISMNVAAIAVVLWTMFPN